MQPVKEKLSNMASAAKEHANIARAKAEEMREKAAARTPEEREIAHEIRKAKEALAKTELHEEKAQLKADRLNARQHSHLFGHQHRPQHGEYGYPIPTPGGEYPMGGATTAAAALMTGPTRPVAGHQADRLDTQQQSHIHVHHHHHENDEYEYPIPTPGGEYPMRCANTAGAAPVTGATDPTHPVAGHPPTTKYM